MSYESLTDEDRQERDLAIVKSHVAQLSEHFCTVHIFVSKQTEDSTVVCQQGAGNWYARYGQVKAWTLREEGKISDDRE